MRWGGEFNFKKDGQERLYWEGNRTLKEVPELVS